ncbi:MAG: MBL fold metallo-hydrolase [Bacteroidales bacterium]|nr:MBL fold metallo-hydrolase [Bacteroidales bacterium]
MNIKIFEFNPLGVNTYLLFDETKECVVIDPASFYPEEKELLLSYIKDNSLKIKHILNTHLHFDHIFGVNMLASQFGLGVQCHPDDLFLLEDIAGQMQLFGLSGGEVDYKPEIGHWLDEGDIITFGNQSLKVFHTPGHSPGSVSFYHEADGCVFSGDLLFYAGVGRTDLPRGSYEALVQSIETKMFTLPNSTVVYSGHGPATTIGFEKKNNPFVGY